MKWVLSAYLAQDDSSPEGGKHKSAILERRALVLDSEVTGNTF